MYRHFLDQLTCPRCGGALTLAEGGDGADPVERGVVRCTRGDFSAPIEGGVLRINDEGYNRNFSQQWKQFPDFEKYYDVDDETYYATGLGLRRADVKGLRVLEIGCGSGRAVRHFLQGEPELFAATDMSAAIDVVQERSGERPDLVTVQCDMLDLPFPKQSFDVVFTYGVLHSTPDPQRYFRHAAEYVKPGGKLAIWVYHKGRNLGAISWLVQRNSHRIPDAFMIPFCWLVTLLAKLLYLQSQTPFLKRFYPYCLSLASVYFRVSPSKHLALSYLQAHDFHTVRYQTEHDAEELYNWFDRAGFHQIRPMRRSGMIGTRKAL